MEFIIAIPIFLLTAMLQSASISRLPLIHGTADLSLLVLIAWGIHSRSSMTWLTAIAAGFIFTLFSQVNWMAVVIPYLLIMMFTRFLHGNFWNSPMIVMLIMSVFGSMVLHLATVLFLFVEEISINLSQAFSEIMLPSVFLNLLLALPFYFLVKDLLRWVNPQVENE